MCLCLLSVECSTGMREAKQGTHTLERWYSSTMLSGTNGRRISPTGRRCGPLCVGILFNAHFKSSPRSGLQGNCCSTQRDYKQTINRAATARRATYNVWFFTSHNFPAVAVWWCDELYRHVPEHPERANKLHRNIRRGRKMLQPAAPNLDRGM